MRNACFHHIKVEAIFLLIMNVATHWLTGSAMGSFPLRALFPGTLPAYAALLFPCLSNRSRWESSLTSPASPPAWRWIASSIDQTAHSALNMPRQRWPGPSGKLCSRACGRDCWGGRISWPAGTCQNWSWIAGSPASARTAAWWASYRTPPSTECS